MMEEREALIALVRWMGEQSRKSLELHAAMSLPMELHAQIRRALGDDFYVELERYEAV
jgi:hypothetical protein